MADSISFQEQSGIDVKLAINIQFNKYSLHENAGKVETRVGCRTLWSDYRKSLPDQFIRIRLKIEQSCRLFLDSFCSAIINDLSLAFTSRLKVDAKCVYQQ